MAAEAYALPNDLEAKDWVQRELALHQLMRGMGGAAITLQPHDEIKGIGGFNDLWTVERAAIRALYPQPSEKVLEEKPDLAASLLVARNMPKTWDPIEDELRPEGFNGRIADGKIRVLDTDFDRIRTYSPGVARIRRGISLLLTGELESRHIKSPSFSQEWSYYFIHFNSPRRVIAPDAGLANAFASLAGSYDESINNAPTPYAGTNGRAKSRTGTRRFQAH